MNLYLTRSGRLRRHDNTLQFESVNYSPEEPEQENSCDETDLEDFPGTSKNAVPVESIDAVYIFSEVSLNTKLLNFLSQQKIPVHIFNYYGHHAGTYLPHAEQLSGLLVIRQAEAFQNEKRRLEISKAILSSTAHNIKSVLRYYARKYEEIVPLAESVAEFEKSILSAVCQDELMGYEGAVRKCYYQAWSSWLIPAKQSFKRVYHPADNPLNATISFANALLYTACVSELYRTALYPGISYIHTPQSRRYSLALDLVEPFKPLIADRLIFRLWNSGLLKDADFLPATNGFILTDDAKRKILSEWDADLRRTIYIDSLHRSVSYRQLLRLDCYKLVNYLLEGRPYQPYRTQE